MLNIFLYSFFLDDTLTTSNVIQNINAQINFCIVFIIILFLIFILKYCISLTKIHLWSTEHISNDIHT